MMKKIKHKFSWLEISIIVFAAAILASLATGIIMYKTYDYDISYNNANKDEDLNGFIKAYGTIVGNYYETINRSEMLDAAINGMMDYLGDNYTTYLSTTEAEALEEQLKGEYRGIGIQIIEGNIIYEVFSNSPASKAGLKIDDVIIKINQEDVTKLSTLDLAAKIKGMAEKAFILTVLRGSNEIEYKLAITNLNIPAVSSEVFKNSQGQTGYLYINTFSNTVEEQVKAELSKLNEQKINSLIIDLRYNSGGYLNAAEGIASLFLTKGKTIYYLKDKSGTTEYKDQTKTKTDYKIVVLINETSASAAEVLAGALKDSYGATIVGVTSFGKGKVQQTEKLSAGGMIKYTTAEWLRPNHQSIDKVGIVPDYIVKLEFDKDYNVIDTQLEKAKDLLKQ